VRRFMGTDHSLTNTKLNLRAGDWIEVRSQQEVLASLDSQGCLDGLPFMPEMLQYCGRRFRVFKRADKTCDNIVGWSIRRVTDAVHLEGLRCDGAAHGNCQASCLIFWKEAWLRRSENNFVNEQVLQPSAVLRPNKNLCTVADLLAATEKTKSGETVYACQSTELRNYTSTMKWWDPRQYIRDIKSGNLDSGHAGQARGERMFETLLATLRVLQSVAVTLFNRYYWPKTGASYPSIVGKLKKTPAHALDLQPGELVQVKSKEEIVETLDIRNHNRGMLFDVEMLPFCGGIYRVLRRVNNIIDEKTGKMIYMKYPCIILEGVYCRADYHRLCPRAIYAYWRENWLIRVSTAVPSADSESREVPECATSMECETLIS
jgi:hypothetical protein